MTARHPNPPTPLGRLSQSDSQFLDRLRGVSVSRVVLGHLGLFWLFPPYTGFLMALLPLLFMVSGAVTFMSWQRSSSNAAFVIRRLIGILVPYWIFCALALLYYCLSSASIPEWNTEAILDWILINPDPKRMPFPMGQVWFLHALALMMMFAPLAFRAIAARRSSVFIFLALCVTLSAVQFFTRIDREMTLFGHNTYQAVSNFGFFVLGAAYFGFETRPRRFTLLAGALVALAIAVSLGVAAAPKLDYKYHSFAPNLYYLAGCFVAILLVLALQKQISALLGMLPPLDKALTFVSNHSFSVFLLHSFFIFGAEDWFNLRDVGSRPVDAALKVVFVIGATAIFATWFSRVSKALTRAADKQVSARIG